MDIYIYNSSLELTGVSDQISSLMWTRKFPFGDTFCAVFPATDKNIRLIRPYAVIEIPGKYSGIITARQINSSEGTINISGCSFDGMMTGRIIADGTYKDSLMTIIDKNIGEAAADPRRRFERTYVDKACDCSELGRESLRYQNLGEYAARICTEKLFLVRSSIEHGISNRIRFYGRRCTDRSVNQSENDPIVFSELYDNISSMDMICSAEGAVNGAFIYSDPIANERGDTTCRSWNGIFGDASGYSRHESVLRIEPAVTYEPKFYGETVVFSPVLDIERTVVKAAESFRDIYSVPTDCVESAVRLDDGYSSRFDVGDIVTVFSTKFGVSTDLRIAEISESYANGGTSFNVTFGEPIKSLKQMIGG